MSGVTVGRTSPAAQYSRGAAAVVMRSRLRAAVGMVGNVKRWVPCEDTVSSLAQRWNRPPKGYLILVWLEKICLIWGTEDISDMCFTLGPAG